MKLCIACGFPVTHLLFKLQDQPLAALYLPRSKDAARNLNRLPLDFHRCAKCGHIFNIDFDYAKVPYENNSNLMYNTGSGWMDYMEKLAARLVEKSLGKPSSWLEIGCGDGNFLERIGKHNPMAKLVGFEPGIEARNAAKRGIEAIEDCFIPERDLKKYRPDFIICRHVLEHLECPRSLLAETVRWCMEYDLTPLLVAEVPCIEKAITNARVNDYLYEHVSNFTMDSFRALFESTGYNVQRIDKDYAEEVLVIEATPIGWPHAQEKQRVTIEYRERVLQQITSVESALRSLKEQKLKIAFWGGTGKGAAFLNSFHIMAEDFPIVVDSDYNKVGRFVPYTAQEIMPPEFLIENPVDAIVITTQWRAKDIYDEICRRKIPYKTIYVLLNQQLTPYSGEVI